jgi:hypothetical protein
MGHNANYFWTLSIVLFSFKLCVLNKNRTMENVRKHNFFITTTFEKYGGAVYTNINSEKIGKIDTIV